MINSGFRRAENRLTISVYKESEKSGNMFYLFER